jgi:hypothetical protein
MIQHPMVPMYAPEAAPYTHRSRHIADANSAQCALSARRRWLMATALMALMCTACQTSPDQAAAAAAEAALAAVPLTFANADVGRAVEQLGLEAPLRRYWRLHMDRDFGARFDMEVADQPVKKEFYVAYYGRSWPLERITVNSSSTAGAEAILSLSLLMRDPDRNRTTTVNLPNTTWRRVDGRWKHVITDPMLNGMRQ